MLPMNLNREFHPLFFPEPDGPEDYEPREFARIKVIRIQAYGPLHRSEASFTTAMRMYTPEEIPDLETFSTIFGRVEADASDRPRRFGGHSTPSRDRERGR
jgi:hypothetical protein